MFQQFASNSVCCDTTHGINAYNFSLATILVADEFGKGFPARWCISQSQGLHCDAPIFQHDLKKMRRPTQWAFHE